MGFASFQMWLPSSKPAPTPRRVVQHRMLTIFEIGGGCDDEVSFVEGLRFVCPRDGMELTSRGGSRTAPTLPHPTFDRTGESNQTQMCAAIPPWVSCVQELGASIGIGVQTSGITRLIILVESDNLILCERRPSASPTRRAILPIASIAPITRTSLLCCSRMARLSPAWFRRMRKSAWGAI